MKKIYFFSLILICIISASSLIYVKSLCEDDDSIFDTLDGSYNCLSYDELFLEALSETGRIHELCNAAFSPKPIILYLERQEKSPPFYPVIFI